jgi:ABC-type enterochelin transport system ATPase subunit
VTAIVETDGLAKRYGRNWALQDCTLSIPPGKVAGLVGPNGAGKTAGDWSQRSALSSYENRERSPRKARGATRVSRSRGDASV